MFRLKPANLEVVVMFLVSFARCSFAERYASESFQILLLVLKFLRKRVILTINACTETNRKPGKNAMLVLLLLSHRLDSARLESQLGVVFKS